MTLVDLAFWAFSTVTLAAALMVTLSRNPVHAVLWMILAFIGSVGLMVLMGAEFVAMLVMIVYVGAVAVLFLFVVMMLDIDFAALKGQITHALPLALLVGIVLMVELGLGFGAWIEAEGALNLRDAPAPHGMDNARALGLILYDKYLYLFQAAGLILLVAMIGAIMLTLRHRKDVKRQSVLAQMWRDPAKAMELKDVKPGQGL